MQHILIIEDEAAIRRVLVKILSEESDAYAVEEAEDGLAGIEKIKKKDYDLVLCDIKMPKMDGYETTRFIRQSELEEYSDIPIIALTANVSPLEKEICLRIGMNDYVAKPFNEKELIKKMNILLTKKAY